MIKVGDKVKFIYYYTDATRIYFGIIRKIGEKVASYPNNINIVEFEQRCFIRRKLDGTIDVDNYKEISGKYFAYSSIEKIDNFDSEIFLELL